MDPYLWLTPVLVFGIMSLIRFIGCNYFYDIRETGLFLPPVQSLTAIPGDGSVELTWVYDPAKVVRFEVYYGTTMGVTGTALGGVTPASGSTHRATVSSLVNGTTYYFTVDGDGIDPDDALTMSEEVAATPGVTAFIASVVLGAERSDFTGWVGMAINVGPAPVTVTQLGRMVAPGNSASHEVKIVAAGGGSDVASVNIIMPAGPVGEFAYVNLAAPVTLQAFGQYYVVSHEVGGGDAWYDVPNTVTTTAVATVTSAAFSEDAMPGYMLVGGPNESYVPVNFRY